MIITNLRLMLILLMVVLSLMVYWHQSKTNWRKYCLFITNLVILVIFLSSRLNFIPLLFLFIFMLYFFLSSRINKNRIGIYLSLLMSISFFTFFKSSLLVFLGLSFLILRSISVILDVKSGKIKKIDFFDFCNYLLFFPTYLSGPTVRYFDIQQQTKGGVKPNAADLYGIIYRFVLGAFKKVVIADFLSDLSIVNAHIDPNAPNLFSKTLLAGYIFAICLYFDFSGYTDMSIAIARLFGFKLPENFNKPWLAINLQDFWNRWHITLASWLKEYIYYPLLYKIKISFQWSAFVSSAIAIFCTFLFMGLWHGFGLNLIFYGALHGFGFVILYWYRLKIKKIIDSFLYTRHWLALTYDVICRVLTLHFVVFSWIIYSNHLRLLLMALKINL